MRRIAAAFVLPCLLAGTGLSQTEKAEPCPHPRPATDTKYIPGQVWHYKTRKGEDESTITVLKVDRLPGTGTVIHVRISGIHLANCAGGPEPNAIEHSPFTRAALDRSVTRLERTDKEIPDFQIGYDDWLKNCGGVYTVTIAETIQQDQQAFTVQQGCPAQQAGL